MIRSILNLLPLTPEERAAFQAAAPGVPQRFASGGAGLAEEDYAAAEVVLGNPPAALLRGRSGLRWLQTGSAGVDAYLEALPEGAVLTSASGAYGHSVSEHMFAMLLALMKRLPGYRDQQAEGLWADLGQVRTLTGAQVLVVGTGDLGSSFARLCKALGAHTAGVRRDPARAAEGIDAMYGMDSLDTLLAQADVVALMLPRSAQTEHLFDRARLLRMKEDAILLNGGRGSAVDCTALAQVLEEGHLWGAGLDVTDPEPLPAGHPLWSQSKALITPHTAGGSHLPDTPRRVARIALDNLERYVRGEPLRNRMK